MERTMPPEQKDGVNAYHAPSAAAWRQWLADNHDREKSVWLIIYKKQSGIDSVYYDEAVDEALCFGWIDSKANSRDEHSYYQYFARRKPKSGWSRVNKEKIERLLSEGRMAPAGLKMIDLAKENGSWTALDDVENLIVPDDLQRAFDANPTAFGHWEKFPRSTKRAILEWITAAKRPDTRQKRIDETVSLAENNVRANQYQPKK